MVIGADGERLVYPGLRQYRLVISSEGRQREGVLGAPRQSEGDLGLKQRLRVGALANRIHVVHSRLVNLAAETEPCLQNNDALIVVMQCAFHEMRTNTLAWQA